MNIVSKKALGVFFGRGGGNVPFFVKTNSGTPPKKGVTALWFSMTVAFMMYNKELWMNGGGTTATESPVEFSILFLLRCILI